MVEEETEFIGTARRLLEPKVPGELAEPEETLAAGKKFKEPKKERELTHAGHAARAMDEAQERVEEILESATKTSRKDNGGNL